jgi:hypothetical protein
MARIDLVAIQQRLAQHDALAAHQTAVELRLAEEARGG